MNSINFTGNLTRDPDLRSTQTGKSVANLRVAIDGARDKDSVYIDVVAWEALGERCAESLAKGSRVGISGRVEPDSYTNGDGKNVERMRVRASSIDFLSPRRQED